MATYSEEVGSRFKQIRFIFNEGGKLSTDQFAYLLGETRDKITNYEIGRASLPIRILNELYKRGINPTYIITGEGSIFADNFNGQNLKTRIKDRLNSEWKFNPESYEILQRSIEIDDKKQNYIIQLAAGKISE